MKLQIFFMLNWIFIYINYHWVKRAVGELEKLAAIMCMLISTMGCLNIMEQLGWGLSAFIK